MLKIADHTFSSHLFTGTGKFARLELMAAAIEASGSQLVTMAIKRLEPGKDHDDILSPLLKLGVKLLPNTSGPRPLLRRYLPPTWPARRWGRTGSSSRSTPTRVTSCPIPSRR